MRILLVSSAFLPYPSGISEHVYYLAKGLSSCGHKVTVLTSHYPQTWQGIKLNLLPEDGQTKFETIRYGKVIFLPLNKSFATFPWGTEIPFRVKQLLTVERFDIIHLHGCYPPEIGFWALQFSKTINCVTFHTVGFRKSHILKLASFLFTKYAKKLHGKIAVSQIAQAWSKPYIPGDYKIIPNGVDCERFSPSVSPINKNNKNSPLILFVGRLDTRKGILVAINAFKKIKENFPDAQLLVVGKGPLEQSARKLTKILKIKDSCLFLGYVNRQDLPSYYALADVYISPALGGEAQGIVLLEALACAKPVVASDIEGYREVIENSKNGLLATPNAPDDLAAKVKLILSDSNLRQSLIKNARISAEKYSWNSIVKRIEDYYLELIARYGHS